MLLERRSSDVSSMPWRIRGTLVLWANSSVGTQFCSIPPGRPAGRPDSTRPWYVRVLDSTRYKPLVNWLQTSCQPRVFFLHFSIGLNFRTCLASKGITYRNKKASVHWSAANNKSRRPVQTDSTPSPRRALHPDPPVVCSGFGLDRSPGREAFFVPVC